MTSSFTCMLSNLADPYPSTQTARGWEVMQTRPPLKATFSDFHVLL